MMKPIGVRGRGRVAGARKGPGLPRPTRYDRGDTTRGRTRMHEGGGGGEGEGRTLFTTAEAAAQLGIGQATVKTAVRLGTLQVERVGPRLNLITATSIEAYRRTHLGRRGRPKGARNRPKDAPPVEPADEASAGREGDV